MKSTDGASARGTSNPVNAAVTGPTGTAQGGPHVQDRSSWDTQRAREINHEEQAARPGGDGAQPDDRLDDAARGSFCSETNTNICGDWGVFRFSGTDTFTVIDFSDGVFQFEFLGRGTYTLTFLDEPQETWNSRWVESFTFHATPGGTIVLTSAFNSFEGPIRIHETMTLVVGPDGSVRVDNATFVVDECPSA